MFVLVTYFIHRDDGIIISTSFCSKHINCIENKVHKGKLNILSTMNILSPFYHFIMNIYHDFNLGRKRKIINLYIDTFLLDFYLNMS